MPIPDEVRTAAPTPIQSEQSASMEVAVAPDDRGDRSSARKAKRADERKVIESLDAMRQLRRQ